MMTIFIDTNIYLRFYDSKQSSFKNLLKSLEEISAYIFFTRQIRDEIDRNKQMLFLSSFDTYISQTKPSNVNLPDHIFSDSDKKISAWNEKRRLTIEAASKEAEELINLKNDLFLEISNGSDEIEKVLIKIEPKPVEASQELFERARLRKERGNPPGKRTDPLGDQINWEQLREYVKINAIEDLIIVSNDDDYFVQSGNTLLLNALLLKEIQEINKNLKVYCYKSLSDALKKFNEIKEIKTLPSSGELEKIKKEEVLHQPTEYWLPFYDMNLAPRNILNSENAIYEHCPSCKLFSRMSLNSIQLRDGIVFGAYKCDTCGAVINRRQ